MRQKAILPLFILLILASYASADYVILDGGDTKAMSFYVWWGSNSLKPRPLWMCDTNYNPHSGNKCAVLKFDPSNPEGYSLGGAQVCDAGWSGINVETFTNLEFWVRGSKGGENLYMSLFDINKPAGEVKTIRLSGLSTRWMKKSFSRGWIMSNASPNFDWSRFEGVQFYDGTPGSTIYFDDFKWNTLGFPNRWWLNGEISGAVKASSLYRNKWSEMKQVYGKPNIFPTQKVTPHSGSYCERLVCTNKSGAFLPPFDYFSQFPAHLLIPNISGDIWDVLNNPVLELWAKGTNGGEGFHLTLKDQTGWPSQMMVVTNLTTNWKCYRFRVTDYLLGSFDPTKIKEYHITWDYGPGVFYLDDCRFVAAGEVFLTDPKATPAVVTNSVSRTVVFSLDAQTFSAGGGSGPPISSIKMDLSRLNGPSAVMMSNMSGETWRYAYTFSTNSPRIQGGYRSIPFTASNAEFLKPGTIPITVVNGIVPVIESAAVAPQLFTNQADRDVTVSLKTYSLLTNLKKVYLDLTAFDKGTVLMTNTTGTSQWSYTWTVPRGTKGGWKSLVTTVSDHYYGMNKAQLSLFISSYPKVISSSAAPTLFSNNTAHNVVFLFRAKSEYTQINRIDIDLSQLGGATNSRLTNISGGTLWRHTRTVPTAFAAGDYSVPVTVLDKAGMSTNLQFDFKIWDRIGPTAPGLVTYGSNLNTAFLGWNPSIEETKLSNYIVVRGDFSGYYDVTNVLTNVQAWTDRNLEWGKEYYYAVYAMDSSGNLSPLSTERRITMPNWLIVYDGETPETVTFPIFLSASVIMDTNKAYSGSYSMKFSGADSEWDLPFSATPKNITGFNKLVFRIKGESGGENVKIDPLFTGAGTWGGETDVALTTNWAYVEVPMDNITNSSIATYGGTLFAPGPAGTLLSDPVLGTGTVDPTYFIGLELSDNTWTGATFMMDDVKFVKGVVTVQPPTVSRTRLTNNKYTDITFRLTAGSTVSTIASADANLSLLGGTNAVPMTNISGGTSYRLTRNVAPGLAAGPKTVILTARDTFGNTKSRLVKVTNIDRLPPSEPSNLAAIPGNTKAFLTWAPATDESAMGSYKILYGTVTNVYTGTLSVGNTTTATLTGLANHTTYFVAVRAVDAAGNQGVPGVATRVIPHFMTVSAASSTPSTVFNLTNTTATFRLQAATSIGSVTNALLDLTSLGGPVTNMPLIAAGTFQILFSVSSAQTDGIYYLPARLTDNKGLVKWTNIRLNVVPFFKYCSAVSTPAYFKNNDLTSLLFRLNVKASNNRTFVSSVTMTTPFGAKVLMNNASGFTSWQYPMTIRPSDKLKGTNYDLAFRAVTPAGTVISTSLVLLVDDTMPPTAAPNFRGRLDEVNGVVLEWDPATDETGIKSYYLLHGTAIGGYDEITNVSPNDRQVISTKLFDSGVTNYYIVAAVDAAGNEGPSPVIVKISGIILVMNPTNSRVYGNYVKPGSPDPFFQAEVAKASRLEIHVYTPFGRKVRTLIEQDVTPSIYTRFWDLKDDEGNDVPTGVYVGVIRIGDMKPLLRKIMVVR